MHSISNEIIASINKAKNYDGVTRIGVFGSYARGENTEDSDIDILFDYYYKNNDENGIDNTLIFLDDLEEDLKKNIGNIKIDFVSLNGLMESSSERIRKNILNDVVWIYDVTSE